eukprot:3282580-Amphidinium_carterae.1
MDGRFSCGSGYLGDWLFTKVQLRRCPCKTSLERGMVPNTHKRGIVLDTSNLRHKSCQTCSFPTRVLTLMLSTSGPAILERRSPAFYPNLSFKTFSKVSATRTRRKLTPVSGYRDQRVLTVGGGCKSTQCQAVYTSSGFS